MNIITLVVLSQLFVPVYDGGVNIPEAYDDHIGLINFEHSNTFYGALVSAGTLDVQGALTIYGDVRFVYTAGVIRQLAVGGNISFVGNADEYSPGAEFNFNSTNQRRAGWMATFNNGSYNVISTTWKGDVATGGAPGPDGGMQYGSFQGGGESGHIALEPSVDGRYLVIAGKLGAVKGHTIDAGVSYDLEYAGFHGDVTFESEHPRHEGVGIAYINPQTGGSTDLKWGVSVLGGQFQSHGMSLVDFPSAAKMYYTEFGQFFIGAFRSTTYFDFGSTGHYHVMAPNIDGGQDIYHQIAYTDDYESRLISIENRLRDAGL